MLEGILKFDRIFIKFIENNLSNEFIQHFFAFFTHLGDFGILTVLAIIYIIYVRRDERITKVTIISALISLLIVQLILKNIIARPRPFEVIEGINIIINKPNTYSFPSGHASFGTIGLISSIKYIKNKMIKGILSLSFILMIISRYILKVHYITDIIAGFIISSLIIYFVEKIINRKSQFI